MTMLYRHKLNARKKGRSWRLFMFVFLCLVFLGINSITGGWLSGKVRDVLAPITTTFSSVVTQPLTEYLHTKHSLVAENESLKRTIAVLEQKQFKDDLSVQEVSSLCSLVDTKGALATPRAHIARPKDIVAFARVVGYERSMFGTLSVVFTDDRTAPVGAYALNEAGVPVGVLREVSSGTGIVDLLSASHVETEVHIGTAIATMTGAGSTTLIARVPQGAHVKAGDAVIMTALGEPLGVVSSTQSTPADAEVTVYIQPSAQPTNIQFLTFVGASKK